MNDPVKQGWKAGLTFVWLIAFAVGLVRSASAFQRAFRAVGRSQVLAAQLSQESQKITDVSRHIQATDKETAFLRGLVTLLPASKSFIRTQRAMSDEVEVLRYKVGRKIKNDLHILVDTRANKLYVKRGLLLLWEADCSVGKGGLLVDKATGRRWEFVTPRGQFDIREKIEKPFWVKPDWAFVEDRQPIPPPGDPVRKVEGELGGYVMSLGDGYLIHGTRNEAALGRPVSHGCVRLGAEDLKKVFETAPRWTRVYIY